MSIRMHDDPARSLGTLMTPHSGADVQGLFQKAIVIAVCMRVAADAAAAARQPPLTQAAAEAVYARLTAVEAAGAGDLVSLAAAVIADSLAGSSAGWSAAAAEADVLPRLQAAVAAGSSPLQGMMSEALHVVQALLVFGRCDGFEGLPGAYVAQAAPPKWAQALLVDPVVTVVHRMFGEVAHELARVCAVCEASYGDFVEQLF